MRIVRGRECARYTRLRDEGNVAHLRIIRQYRSLNRERVVRRHRTHARHLVRGDCDACMTRQHCTLSPLSPHSATKNTALTQPRPTNQQSAIRLASRDLLRRRNRDVRVSGLLVRVHADIDDALDTRVLLEVGFQYLLVVYAGVLDDQVSRRRSRREGPRTSQPTTIRSF